MANDFVTRNGFISLDNSQITGSLSVTQGITGSLFGSSSWSSTTISSSFVLNATTASLGLTASSADQFNVRQNVTASSLTITQNTILSGSVQATGSVNFFYLSSAWSTGGTMITARSGLAGAGTQNEGLAFGGANKSEIFIGDSFGCTCTEEYNGTSWAAGGAMSSSPSGGGLGAGLAGVGTQNEALGIGGAGANGSFILPFRCSVEYNGTAWSGGGSPNVGKIYHAAAGTQNSAVAFGGLCLEAPPIPSQVSMACTEEYNGSSWSTGGAMITARRCLAGAGTQNEALAFGAPTCTEEYNGTTWASGGSMITGRSGLAGAGSQNAALGFGSPTNTEEYDGTTWTTRTAMITGRAFLGGAGSQALALAFGGEVPTCVACTEEYNRNAFAAFSYSPTTGQISASGSLFGTASFAPTTSFATSASFATSGSFARSASLAISASFVTTSSLVQNSSLVISASFLQNPTASFALTSSFATSASFSVSTSFAITSSLVPSVFTTLNVLFSPTASFITTASFAPTASSVNILSQSVILSGSLGVFAGNSSRLRVESTGVTLGNQIRQNTSVTGSLIATGSLAVTGSIRFSYILNGVGADIWAAGGAMISNRASLAGAGTQNLGLGFGNPTSTEEYNGTTWSAGGAMITARNCLGGAGTQNEGLGFGGRAPGVSTATEEYNGTTWATGGALITARWRLGGAGSQNAGLAFGGTPTIAPAYTGTTPATEEYDGTVWASGGGLATSLSALAGAGTQNEGLAFGGYASPFIAFTRTCTQRYNGTTWSAGSGLINGRRSHAGAGIQNSAAALGGIVGTYGPQVTAACAEFYNGISWSTGASMLIARNSFAATGAASNCMLAFGNPSATEEYGPGPGPFISFENRFQDGMLLLSRVSSSLNYASDAAAAAGGVPLGGLYRNGSLIQIRIV